MSKDVKIEVLYFKCSNDISIEFGLHGNYPVRMLTSVCNNLSSFFKCLKRAVSRSEIIVTVGGYTDDNYLPSLIATAIGKDCSTPNYRGNSIITKNNYLLPEGAIPLASSSRLFGGFLIESGPQAIISLTDDKKVRLEVVNKFVVNYITEHYNVFNAPTKNDDVEDTNNLIEKNNVIEASNHVEGDIPLSPQSSNDSNKHDDDIVEFEDISSSSDNSDTSIENTVVDNDLDDIDNTDFNTASLSVLEELQEDTNAEQQDEQSPTTETNTQPLNQENENLITKIGLILPNDDDIDYSKPHRRYRTKRIICIILSLIVILSSLAYVIVSKSRNKTSSTNNTINSYAYIQELFNTYEDSVSAFNALQSINRDINMWLSVESSDINHPVISLSQGASEEYYLTHLPNGESNTTGSVFVYDKSATSDTLPGTISGNKAIYSSAVYGGVFHSLTNFYATPSLCIDKKITVQDRYLVSQWQIFSVFKASDVGNWNYMKSEFLNTSDYLDYLSRLIAVSNGKSNITFTGNEPLVLLIGITENEKYIVAAALCETNLHQPDTSTPSLNSNISSSSDANSNELTSSNTSSTEEDGEEDHEENPIESEITLPSLPSNTTSSSKPSVSSSTVTVPSQSISASSSKPLTSSTTTSISSTSSTPSTSSTTSTTSSTNSSSTSTNVINSSNINSSNTSSSNVSSPSQDIDPIYTWDIQLSIKDKNGNKYTKDAVEIIAMIIEKEMSPTIDPPEALKAQAVAAYNWLLNNGARNPDTAPTVAMELPLTKQAIQYANEAKGMLVIYDNTIAKTNYYAYSAGKTACTQDIWGGKAYPYLQSVDCSVDEELKDFITVKTFSASEIQQLILQKCNIDVSSMPKTEWLVPKEYDQNGVYCRYINIGGSVYKGTFLRGTLLSGVNGGIRSTAYTIEYNEEDDTFTVTCKGYGHGVGMSQRGAKAYAKQGWTCEQILTHFFPGTTIIKNGIKQE